MARETRCWSCASASRFDLPALRYHEIISMRGTRWLLLVAIVAILSGLGLTYRAQKQSTSSTISAAAGSACPRPEFQVAGIFLQPHEQRSHHAGSLRRRHDRGKRLVARGPEGRHAQAVQQDRRHLRPRQKRRRHPLQRRAPLLFRRGGRDHARDAEDRRRRSTPRSPSSRPASPSTPARGQANTDRPSSFAFENGTGSATGAFYDPGHPRPESEAGRETRLEARRSARQADEDRGGLAVLPRGGIGDLAQAVGPPDARQHRGRRPGRHDQAAGGR